MADQSYSFVKAVTSSHASCIFCLLQSSDSSAVPSNVPRIAVTELVSQASGWLKASASSNVLDIVVTLLVSHASSWLKAPAFRNVYSTLVTLLVSQPPICASKLLGKKPSQSGEPLPDMSSTRDVSHPEMLPCVASAVSGLATHSSTAALSAARSPKAPAGSGGGLAGAGSIL